jgi:hypothetical protein
VDMALHSINPELYFRKKAWRESIFLKKYF